jgi:transcriptional regulator with XRE-family HTH domain
LATFLAGAGQTARDLADDCGVSEATISMLRTGRTREPGLRLAFDLLRAAGIEPKLWLQENRLAASNLCQLKRPRGKLSEEPPDEGEQENRRHARPATPHHATGSTAEHPSPRDESAQRL